MSDITLPRGSSRTLELTVVDSNSVAVDLTGATVYFTVKQNPNDTTALISKDSGTASEITILDQVSDTGKAQIFLVHADTENLSLGKKKYDVWIVEADSDCYQVVGPSDFDITANVTVLP